MRTEDGTAKSTSDYISTSQELVFYPGETTKKIPIVIQNDATIEVERETFLIQLLTTNPEQIFIGTPHAACVVTINDDDGKYF